MAHHHVTSADSDQRRSLGASKPRRSKVSLGVAVVGTVISLYLLFFLPEDLRPFCLLGCSLYYFYLTLHCMFSGRCYTTYPTLL
jgi:hypothetical protein